MKKEWLFFGGAILFIIHMAVIYDDVQAVVDDPNMENKPTEVLKLILAISRYFPK